MSLGNNGLRRHLLHVDADLYKRDLLPEPDVVFRPERLLSELLLLRSHDEGSRRLRALPEPGVQHEDGKRLLPRLRLREGTLPAAVCCVGIEGEAPARSGASPPS